jgi:hypothetical protein
LGLNKFCGKSGANSEVKADGLATKMNPNECMEECKKVSECKFFVLGGIDGTTPGYCQLWNDLDCGKADDTTGAKRIIYQREIPTVFTP